MAEDLRSDFYQEWSRHVTIPYLVLAEQDAWEDEASFRARILESEQRDLISKLTQPPTPTRSSDFDPDMDSDEDDLRRHHRVELLTPSSSRAQSPKKPVENQVMDFGTMAILLVFIVVLLHGLWTHWDEAKRRGRCSCVDLPILD